MSRTATLFPTLGLLLLTAAPALVHAQDPAREALEGTWIVTAIMKDGESIAPEGKPLEITFGPGKYALTAAEGFTHGQRGEFQVDGKESPRQILIKPTDGPNKDKPILGIYRIDGEMMEACYDPKGAARPSKFAAEKGTGFVLVRYKRKAG